METAQACPRETDCDPPRALPSPAEELPHPWPTSRLHIRQAHTPAQALSPASSTRTFFSSPNPSFANHFSSVTACCRTSAQRSQRIQLICEGISIPPAILRNCYNCPGFSVRYGIEFAAQFQRDALADGREACSTSHASPSVPSASRKLP